ncbi:MAG TPA: NB-ARC domain-containing protein [Aggregatilineales bacterium]|nr:hypothetical protein [Anaerolineales bacterium]HRE46836.1 NB-ARC domain-containing protein [Aggregatilineales bacterium]
MFPSRNPAADATPSDPTQDREGIIRLLEHCLAHYADDLTLSTSLFVSWQVVRGNVPLFPPPTTAKIGQAVRTVLDEIIDSLRQVTGNADSPAQRRYVIADRLYRQGEKPGEIYTNTLLISKAQFYRERGDTLDALAERLIQAEHRARDEQRTTSVRRLAMLPPATTARLFGVDWALHRLADVLLSADAPALVVLDGLGGLGKTAVAREAVAHVWRSGAFEALAWISAQTSQWVWSRPQPTRKHPLGLGDVYDQLLPQLNQSLRTPDDAFGELVERLEGDETPTFEAFLTVVDEHQTRNDPPEESLRAKFQLVLERLWAARTLIVLDGLEAVRDIPAVLTALHEAVSSSRSKVVITSRRRLSEYQNAYALHLNELDSANALLLAKHYAAERGVGSVAKASQEELLKIIEAAGANPLAIRLLIDRLSALPLSQVYEDFCETGDLSRPLYEHVYDPAWEALSEAAQGVLRSLAAFPAKPGTEVITWERLRSRNPISPKALNAALLELASACLVHVTENLSATYWISTLTRRYVLSREDT